MARASLHATAIAEAVRQLRENDRGLRQGNRATIVPNGSQAGCLAKILPQLSGSSRKRLSGPSRKRRKKRTGDFRFDARKEAYPLYGVDVTRIPGLDGLVIPLFSEVGRDLKARFGTSDRFSSRLGLRPPEKVLISGGASWLTDQRVVETLCGPIPSAIFPLTKDFRVFRRVWRHSSPGAGCLRPGLSVFCAVGKRVSRCCRASRI